MYRSSDLPLLVGSNSALPLRTGLPRAFARSVSARRPERRPGGLTFLRCSAEKDNESLPERKRAQRRTLSDGSILFMFGEIDTGTTDSRKSKEEVLKELKNVHKTSNLNNSQLTENNEFNEKEIKNAAAEAASAAADPIQPGEEKTVYKTRHQTNFQSADEDKATQTDKQSGETESEDATREETEVNHSSSVRELKKEREQSDGRSTNSQSVPRWTQQELSHLRVEDLRQLCRESGIRRYSQLRKAELIETMLKSQ